MDEQSSDYTEVYSEKGFWQKVKGYALKAGSEVIGRALLLYYAAQRPDTPVWAKSTIYGALGYFISMADAVPDITPIVGYTDDLGVLALAIATIAAYIDDGVREKAANKTRQWFGEDEAKQAVIDDEPDTQTGQ